MLRMALHWQILLAMLLGAAIGVGANVLAGGSLMEAKAEYPGGRPQLLEMTEPIPIEPSLVWAEDSPERTLIQIDAEVSRLPGREPLYETRRIVVGEPPAAVAGAPAAPIDWPQVPPQVDPAAPLEPRYYPTLNELKADDPAAYVLFHLYGRSPARVIGDIADTFGELFLRMLMMVSIPLIVTSLITGITGLGQAEQFGRMFGRTILYYIATSLLAIITGLVMVNLIRPGVENVPPPAAAPAAADVAAADGDDAEEPPVLRETHREGKGLLTVLFEQVQTMIPKNPFEALARAEFLSVIAFSLFFGICTILVGGRTAEAIGQFFSAAFEVMMTMTMFIIRLAPYGVFFLMLSATASQGISVFGTLGWYMITVACALFVHAVITLPLILHFIAKRSPWRYAQALSPALVTAFSSASSNGTLPLTITCVEERAGISNRVGSFVLPLGATINMDGTALYEVVAVLFIAQYSGIELSLAQQIVVAFTALLASIGAAGIPHAGLVMMIIILQAVNLPTESQGLIIAVDRVLDMCRTAVNVWSDSCGCAVVARSEAASMPAAAAPAGAASVDV